MTRPPATSWTPGQHVPAGPVGLLPAGQQHGYQDAMAVHDLVSTITAEVNRRLAEARRDGNRPSSADQAAIVEQVIAEHLALARHRGAIDGRPPLDPGSEEEVRLRARQAHSPLGPLGPHLAGRQWSDVEVNGAVNMICTERVGGTRAEFPSPFATDGEAFEWVAEQAALAGRRFDESNPSVRFRTAGGVRIHAISRVTSITHIDCRIYLPGLDRLDGLAAAGMFNADVHAVLEGSAALREPVGLVISGGTGAGKTTLLRAWANAHPDPLVLDRVVTVEDEQELFLPPARFRNLVAFEAREANVDGKGEYSMERYLTENLRRQTPYRVLLGELKPDGGVLPLLLAVGQGIAQGVATTVHAPSAEDVIHRLRTYAALGTRHVPDTTVLETIAATVDLVVHVARVGGRRVVTAIREYVDYRDSVVTSTELWRWHPAAGQAVRTDREMSERLTAKLLTAGVDPAVLHRRTGDFW
ncbi:ATPase, T2SS/T4P/T4SS family [Protofrankia symbiont of Coriaria ruscifolia]|uniref:ATPase, T2SS/T4P/T4SS family n=1 Tax=Protofrankia symbiont of Coriaria ruscifolia TaxID=1306542 RepID=UPI001F5F9F09|nr:ATPase, T2SS/T4P/T4SS family [Protofrankia symbiont of Coriaria ruscifolia]